MFDARMHQARLHPRPAGSWPLLGSPSLPDEFCERIPGSGRVRQVRSGVPHSENRHDLDRTSQEQHLSHLRNSGANLAVKQLSSYTPQGYCCDVAFQGLVKGRCTGAIGAVRSPLNPLVPCRRRMDPAVRGTELRLAASAAGCSCCSTEVSSASTAANTTEFAGMTCGHCV